MEKNEMLLSKVSKMLAEVEEIMDELDIDKKNNNHKKNKTGSQEEPDQDDPDFDMENVMVRPVDGVLIKNDEEEVRLLFFYIKPEFDEPENESFRYKAVAEFRLPCSTFQKMAKNIEKTASDLKNYNWKNNDFTQEKISMFA